jgi:hypothetical protein
VLEITEVVRRFDLEHVRASWFGVADVSDSDSSYALGFEGWLVGEHSPVQAIEVSYGGLCLWRLGINVWRPDVQAIHGDVEWSLISGFNHAISTLKLPTEFEIDVGALLKDDTRTPIATVRGRRRALPARPSELNPLAVTTLGRTGSTWVLDLLSRHPRIVSFRPFEYEAKLVRYWTDILGALSEPASYRQALSAEIYGADWFIGTLRQAPPPTPFDPGMEQWLAGPNVEELAATCRTRIDRFYEEAASRLKKPGARYFAEKGLPGTFREQILPELYPGAKEVFLVRDFRDMASSMLEFERRLPFQGFMSAGMSGEEFVRGDLRRDIDILRQSWMSRSSTAFLLRYEDLVQEPVPTLTALLEHLGFDHDDAVIDQMLHADRREELLAQHQTSPSAAKSIGRWRREEPSIQAACTEAFADLLESFGYSR